MSSRIIIGTRGSVLALTQANYVAHLLATKNPDLEIEIQTIKTQGDKILDTPIWKIGDKGLFVKELETALISNQIDLAVHSVKDLPAVIPDELCLAAFPPREDPSDVLVTASNQAFDELPNGAVIGTSALRRQSQILHRRPDLNIKLLRGNVDTRLRKLDEGNYFGIIVAKAGLTRLGVSRGVTVPTSILIPAPGQGALALQTRKKDRKLIEIAALVNHDATRTAVAAERSFLARMEGGCSVPLGALAVFDGGELFLRGFFGTPDGTQAIFDEIRGSPTQPEILGEALASRILSTSIGSRRAG